MHRDRAAYPPRDHFRRLALASETEDRTSGTQQPRATGPRRWPHPHPRIPRHRRPRQPHYVLQSTAHSGCRGARPRFRAGPVHGRQTSPPFRPDQGQPGHRQPHPRPQPSRLEANHGPTKADHPDRRGQPANLRVITVTKASAPPTYPCQASWDPSSSTRPPTTSTAGDRDRHAADAAFLVSLTLTPGPRGPTQKQRSEAATHTHPHISVRPGTFHAFPTEKLSRGLGVANLMIVHRLSDLDSVGSSGTGSNRVPLMSMFHLCARRDRQGARHGRRGYPSRRPCPSECNGRDAPMDVKAG
jgi:hypothetical protein